MVTEKVMKVEVEKNVVSFWCDKCGKFLGESDDYGHDGYVPTPEAVRERYASVYWNGQRYCYKACLCAECLEKGNERFVEFLTDFGFVSE